MARLLKGDKVSEPHRARRLSFKTKGSNERRNGGVRVVKVTVPSNSVAAIASKFNAVIVEDEQKGRALLKKKLVASSKVREAVLKFEGLQGTPMVLVRKNSSSLVEKIEIEKVPEPLSQKTTETRPRSSQKPRSSIDRKSNSRYVKKDLKELLGKEKRFSLPKTQLLDQLLDGEKPSLIEQPLANSDELLGISPETTDECDSTVRTTSGGNSSLFNEKNTPPFSHSSAYVSNNNDEKKTIFSTPEDKLPPDKSSLIEPVACVLSDENTYGNNCVILESESHNNKQVKITRKESIRKNDIRPNSSFLWGVQITAPETQSQVIQSSLRESNDPIECAVKKQTKFSEKENSERTDISTDNKENVEKLEAPVVRQVDKKGYGKINAPANSSSLYRNILKQTLIGEIKERLEKMEKDESKSSAEICLEKIVEPTKLGDDKTEHSERGYEVIDETYEPVGGFENSYDEICSYRGKTEAIYDDVAILQGERIYESIYNECSRHQNDSDSSSDLQTNSLYELRPPSQASSGSSGAAGRASRSDTSDEWVDVELESSEEQKEQILLLRGTPRHRPEGWTVKVRRQWSTRSKSSHRIIPDDSDGSSKHYELVDNRDDDSAVCDDFDDSSDSDISDAHNYKPDVEERLAPAVESQPEGIYGLMMEAKKRMRMTSSSIGKSLRKISRIKKTTSAQDIFGTANGVGLPRGKWPSFKKKSPQATSTFYLNEAAESIRRSPPPRPPPPTSVDPRRLSVSVRPTSPPPPPPPTSSLQINGDSKGKAINDTSLYAECGLFEQNPNVERRNNSNSWYSDIGLYENSRPSDTASEHGSSLGSDLDLRFSDEPLYQFYTERVAKEELSEDLSETGYEEIGENRNSAIRPSALDLVSPEMHRTLWCQVPQVISSGILDTLSPERKKLQEAKFEVVTSEASYYKSLTILEKHFAASPLLKDESVLPKVDYKTLFGNVSAVRKCSEAVLAALEKCWQDSILLEGLSDVINDVAEKHFSVYKKYCTNQLAIERTVKTLKKTNQSFADALETLQKSPKCHNLAFYSFVLLPMQRITRMPLLQDAIFTKLSPEDPEYESCRMALARLNKIVHECNEAARQSERMEEMILLSRAITFPADIKRIPLLSASRWLVRSGDMTHIPPEPKATFSRKLTAPRNPKFRLFLFTDYLVVTKKKGEDNFLVVTYCERNLVQMSDVEEPIPNRFLIMLTLLKNHEGKTQEMVLCCGGESSRARWISALSPPASVNPGESVYEDWDCPQVCASHAYLAAQPDELQLQSGDVINVLRKTLDGWYYGEKMRDGEKGWFPGNHTVEILSAHVRAKNLKQRYRLLALSSNFIQKQLISKTSS